MNKLIRNVKVYLLLVPDFIGFGHSSVYRQWCRVWSMNIGLAPI
jgi:hypothetical protein